MSALSQDVFAASGVPISVVGAGGGGGGPVPPNLVVSTISTDAIINLSSINGLAYVPGGGGTVPANLVVSTLTTSGAAILGDTVNIGGRVTQGSTFMQSAGLNLVNLSIDAPYGTLGMTNISTIFTSPQVSMSGNLRVSSINGAVPAPEPVKLGGYGFTVGSFSTTQAQFFPDDLSNRMFSMSTIAGHTYRLDITTKITPTQPSALPASVPADNSFIVYINNGATTVYTDSIPTVDVYNISRGPLSSFNAAYSIPFLAAGASAQAYIGYANNNAAAPFVFTNTTAISSLTSGLLTDLGAL
jgi:hypothetical protein